MTNVLIVLNSLLINSEHMFDRKMLEIQGLYRLLWLGVLFILIVGLFGCTTNQGQQGNTAQNTKLKVSVTFFPLYEVAKNIGGDYTEVTPIVPLNVEPHDYDPTPGQLAQISDSKVVILLGTGFDTVESKMTNNVGKDLVIVKASEGIELMNADPHSEKAESLDPHIWLSPKRMAVIATNIKNAFQKADPEHSAQYEKNARDYINKLNDLDNKYMVGLANCSKNAILTSHAAFGYLAKDYGFKQITISDLAPDSEPSPQKIAELVDIAKKENITYIFYEELVDPKVSQTIADEVGAKAVPLSPLEGTKNPSADYFSIMEENLKSIQLARGCS